MSDLIEQLRKYDAYMSEARERMVTAIRREFPNEERAEDEAIVTRSIHREAADRIEQLTKALEDMCIAIEREPTSLVRFYEGKDSVHGLKSTARKLREDYGERHEAVRKETGFTDIWALEADLHEEDILEALVNARRQAFIEAAEIAAAATIHISPVIYSMERVDPLRHRQVIAAAIRAKAEENSNA